MKIKAPLAVTTMRLTVLILALWNILRLGATLANWRILVEFAPIPSPYYIAGSASAWTLACLAVWTAISRRNSQSQGFYALTVLGYIAWWWADRLFLFGQPRPNWPFAAAITAIVLFDTVTTFFNANATAYFTQRESHDQQPTNQ